MRSGCAGAGLNRRSAFKYIRMKLRLIVIAAAVAVSLSAHAQIFAPGNLVVTRSTYTGDASTVTYPNGTLPNGAASSADGTYPTVFNNETPDPSFGVTSPIFIDQLTTTGSFVSTFNVTAAAAQQGINLATSFPSKSELGLNLTPDGTGVTFMAYGAAANQLDISNSNTPGHVDPTNPDTAGTQTASVNGAPGAPNTQRDVVQVSSAGTIQVTPTNAYSGNNGRNAVLGATGNYYMVGNAGNGGKYSLSGVSGSSSSTTLTSTSTSGLVAGELVTGTGIAANTTISSVTDSTHFVVNNTPTGSVGNVSIAPSGNTLSMLSDNTGVQMISPGSGGDSTVVGQAYGTYGSTTGYQHGVAGQPADKTGKDANFRGLINYNNTLYTTKGSGSNGVNSVYQVNPSGAGYVNAGTGAGLPTSASAGSATINILPGFATSGTSTHPFGLWFANATTVYVGDEGPGNATDAFGGLEKWTFDGTKWNLVYTLQSGLVGSSYTVTDPNNPNNTISPKGDGLRNIIGKMNDDGTVTIFGVTFTYGSSLTDAGADPNQLVAITDSLGATSLPSNESFSVLETAQYGDVLRGVTFAAVPEPSAISLLCVGAAAASWLARRRRRC